MDNARKSELISDDKKFVWHPFTQMADWQKDVPGKPLVIDSAKGNYLYDIDGNKYLDGVSSLWVTLHGHGKKEIDAAISKQLRKVSHSTFLGLTHQPAIELAKKLVSLMPKGISKVFYSDNGSTAVEVALKMSYQFWSQSGRKNRNKFLSLRNAYHGDTIGSVSVGGIELFHSKFKSLLSETLFAPTPYCYRCPKRRKKNIFFQKAATFSEHCRNVGCEGECIAGVESILRKYGKEISAAIVEPMIQAAAGMITFPTGYLKEFERLCRKYGTLLICDEVATGFGRTGSMFAIEHENIRPDFICLAKGITGGYLPLAATLTTQRIFDAFLGKYEEYKTFFHGHTYTANPLACSAAIANLEIFRNEHVISKLQPKIKRLARELGRMKAMRWVGDIRQLGLMAGIELVKNNLTGEDFDVELNVGAKVCEICRKKGLIIRPLGNIIVFMPPLSITGNEITKMVSVVEESIAEQCENL